MSRLNLFLLLFFLSSLAAIGQVQEGMVRKLNSGKQPIHAVEIIFQDAVPTTSAADGQFRLVFQDKAPGDLIFLERIHKAGYELVNEKDFEIIGVSSDEQLPVDVILAAQGTVAAARKEYYRVSDAALLAGFAQEKRALRLALEQAQLNRQEYIDQLSDLQERYDRQQQRLTDLAEKFARVNFDDVEPIYREALQLFKAGKINESIARLESTNPAQRTEQIIQEEKRIARAQAELNQQRSDLQREKKKQIAAVKLLADMYTLSFDPGKATSQYDQLLRLDSTDLDVLRDAADFFLEQHTYDKAFDLYAKMIRHPKAEAWQVGKAYRQLGAMHFITDRLDLAMGAFQESAALFDSLYTTDPTLPLYQRALATTYERMGDTYSAFGQQDSALIMFKKQKVLNENLHRRYPNEMDYAHNLSIAHNFLGDHWRRRGNMDSALFHYREDYGLTAALLQKFPEDPDIRLGLALVAQDLGSTHIERNQLDSALYYFQQQYEGVRDLYTDYPQSLEFKKGLAIASDKMGNILRNTRQLDSALVFHQRSSQLIQELRASHPKNVEFAIMLAINHQGMGDIYAMVGQPDTALHYYKSYHQLSSALRRNDPENVNWTSNTAIAASRIADYFTGVQQLDSALVYREDQRKMGEQLVADGNKNGLFRTIVVSAYSGLGQTYKSLGQFDQALSHAQEAYRLQKKFSTDTPENPTAVPYLLYTTMGLGDISLLREASEKALEYYDEAENLLLGHPDDPRLQGLLEEVQNKKKTINSLSAEDIAAQAALQKILHLEQRAGSESEPTTQVHAQEVFLDSLQRIHRTFPTNGVVKQKLASVYGALAWYYVNNRQFQRAEEAARAGLEVDPSQEWINSNLALGLLFQGKKAEAMAIYADLKSKPYGEGTYKSVFLQDLQHLEALGIMHADAAAVRA